jgi:hypothetical protein
MSLLFDCDLLVIRLLVVTSRALERYHLRAELIDMIGLPLLLGVCHLQKSGQILL